MVIVAAPVSHRDSGDKGIWSDPAGLALGFGGLAHKDPADEGHQSMSLSSVNCPLTLGKAWCAHLLLPLPFKPGRPALNLDFGRDQHARYGSDHQPGDRRGLLNADLSTGSSGDVRSIDR